jgi:uncharacterized protein YegJ (DUF2314 family)
MLTGRFGNQPGIDIPVGRDTQDMNAIVADMTAKQIIVPPSMSEDMVLARIKIDFRYRDVFEDIWIDDAYFTALMKKIGTTWVIGENNISAMPRPNDWSDGNYDSQEEA